MAQVERQARTSAVERGGFVPVVRRWWWLLALSAVLAGAIGYIVSSSSDPTYESRVQLVVGPINTDLDTQRAAGQLAQLYTELAISRPVLATTVEQLGLSITPSELSAQTIVTADEVTRVLTIRVQAANPNLSASIANALADSLAQLVGRDVTRPEGELSIFDPAQPGDRIGVDTAFVIVLAALAGVLGTFTLVLLGEFLRNAVKDDEELADLAQTRSLGMFDGTPRGPLVVQTKPDSSAASFYRLLAAEIEFLDRERPPRSLLVLGVTGGEGAGEITSNLAATFVAAGRSVAVVDANQDEREVTALFDLDQRVGVNDLLARPALLEGSERFWRSPRTHSLAPDVVPIGTTDGDSVEPEHVEKLLARLLDRHDLVIVNADPLRRSPKTLTWARAVDATVLVGLGNRVKREHVVDAAESLRLVGATLIGTILSRGRGIRPDLMAGRRRRSAPAPVPAQAAADSGRQEPEHTAPTSIRRKGDAPRTSSLPTPSESHSPASSAASPGGEHAG